MTYEEAIKELKQWRELAINRGSYYGENAIEASAKAIEALEKQIPKKPKYYLQRAVAVEFTNIEARCYVYRCPSCNRKVINNGHHCECGQALDWECR